MLMLDYIKLQVEYFPELDKKTKTFRISSKTKLSHAKIVTTNSKKIECLRKGNWFWNCISVLVISQRNVEVNDTYDQQKERIINEKNTNTVSSFWVSSFKDDATRSEVSNTLESGINKALRLLIYEKNSRGYGLITDLKDLHFTT